MAKRFTIAQVKELMDIHENTINKTFTCRPENMDSKIKNMQEENNQLKHEVEALEESKEFQNETCKKMKNVGGELPE